VYKMLLFSFILKIHANIEIKSPPTLCQRAI
jgi:hypothetical protein